jgi:hypothetical protein
LFCTCSIPLGLHNLAIEGVLCTMSLSSKWGDLFPFYQSGRYHNYILILLYSYHHLYIREIFKNLRILHNYLVLSNLCWCKVQRCNLLILHCILLQQNLFLGIKLLVDWLCSMRHCTT